MSTPETVEGLRREFEAVAAELGRQPREEAVEAARVVWLGRKGHITKLFEDLKQAPPEVRPILGKAANELRQLAETAMKTLRTQATDFEIELKLAAPALDVTLPVASQNHQHALHPVSLMQKRLIDIFRRYGFTVYDGPELEYDFYNFSALNIPEHHPARDMQDTFFLANQPQLVMRTHTSNIQIHSMLQEKPPLRLVATGRVFRFDNDATHTPMFHQFEAVVVDEGLSLAHMKGMIDTFTKDLFGSSARTRLRPSYFPFVEPGGEVDVGCTICSGKGCRVCKHSGWIEIGGCGMIHPNVFEAVQYDSERYTGFAWGFGVDRMAMLLYGLEDLRQMFEGDSAYARAFSVHGRG